MSLRNKVEALLFASGKYLEEHNIAEILKESKSKVVKALEELKQHYEESQNALDLQQAGDNWKMTVKADYHDVVQNVVSDTELETPVLETLAVIAWKRPVLQSEVVDIRGSGAYDHIKILTELEFITRERHGRTYKLKLDKKFFEYFDVEGDEDIRELFANVERPEPEVKEPDESEEQSELPPMRKKEDAAEKRKKEREELEEFDKELDTISERTKKHIEELDEFKDDEGDDEDAPAEGSSKGTIAQED